MISIVDAARDPNLFGPWYARGDFSNWLTFFKARYALPPDPKKDRRLWIRDNGQWKKSEPMSDMDVYRQCTMRSEWPKAPFRSVWMPIGRRGGKSLNLSVEGAYMAAFHDYRRYLQPGERATISILAADRSQARIILRYIKALFANVPLLKDMIQRETAEGLDLTNSSTIEVTTASSRTSRGYSFAAVLCDEVAFWKTDEGGNDPDSAILQAMRPGMATIPTSTMFGASSPYARQGELWRNYDKHFGTDSDTLVWNAPTWVMNPTIDRKFIDEEYEKDLVSASAEFGAEFRKDIEAFVSIEVLRECTEKGIRERAPVSGVQYRAFVDPSGGSADGFTLAIAHNEGDRVVLDLIREVKPPFSPESVVKEYSDTVKTYGIATVTGDRYAGEWPRERFRDHGVTYEIAPAARTELYLTLLPAMNSRRCVLLDDGRLFQQLLQLERRASRAGRDLIDHPPGGHDDVANAVAGAVFLALEPALEPPTAVFGRYT